MRAGDPSRPFRVLDAQDFDAGLRDFVREHPEGKAARLGIEPPF
ncbi:MAG: hypothetical protein WA633_10315 [Stellaceae bacterium]